MAEFKIQEGWDKIKVKIQRKYRDVTDADLNFNAGMENEMILHLMKTINKDRNYVEFMLKKMDFNKDNNRV